MAMSPVAGLSQNQLAVIEQIRALRAAKPPGAAAAPAQPAGPAPAKAAARPSIDRTATLSAADPQPANRPRGSILNITA
ncbi:MAG TPA: hypothetical protein VKV32_06610 [Stellaceae bacterium]|nr:hypothetical protein [Stellaceae bacterium]